MVGEDDAQAALVVEVVRLGAGQGPADGGEGLRQQQEQRRTEVLLGRREERGPSRPRRDAVIAGEECGERLD